MGVKRKRLYKIKEFVQTIIFLIEISLFIGLVLSIYSKIETGNFFCWFNEIKEFEFLGRVTVIFAFYQLLIYSFIRLRLSARQDVILSMSTLTKSAIHLANFDVKMDPVLTRCDLFINDTGYMIDDEDIQTIIKIKDLTEKFKSRKISKTDYLFWIKSLEIELEHKSEYNRLTWKNSIFLNRFK